MKTVLQTIRILVVTSLVIGNAICQDGFSDQDILRLQQLAAGDGQIETITSYSTNIIQRDPNSQSMSSVRVQYHMTDDADKNEDYNRAERGRSRKVYRIKNPFQRQLEHDDRQKTENTQDTNTGASNQYAAMQYSLPPEEFLQQMRAENQYYQQQQQQQQQHQQQQQQQHQQQLQHQQQQQQQQQYVSTPAPNLGYTATPQPQYQYSTINPSNYDNHPNQIPQLEQKLSHSQAYRSNNNPFQFNGPNTFQYDSVQSTPAPVSSYLSTALPSNQYVGTPANNYVSSSSPVFSSSQSSLQQYVSSPLAVQSSSIDYNNNRPTSTVGNNYNFENNDFNKKLQIDHYDNSANGVRYPNNLQQQYQNEYQTPTPLPSSSPYSDPDNWQNSVGVNSLSKSLQEVSLSQYSNSPFKNNEQDSLSDMIESSNSDTHRVGTLAPTNMYLNFIQPDYQALNNVRNRIRDLEQETSQPSYYSHGDYGWRMGEKKPYSNQDNFASGNFPRHHVVGLQSENTPVSQMSFQMDTGKSYNYEQTSKSASDNLEAQEFAKAAAKAHEQLKQQQIYDLYQSNYNNNHGSGNSYYNHNDKKPSQSNSYGNSQLDLITASPLYYQSARENNINSKPKQPFDHAKALKNIVPIDVSNVVPNSDNNKQHQNFDSSSRYAAQNYNKDINEHNLKQYYKQITDSYYKDKNTGYGYNIRTKPEDVSEDLKQLEQNIPYYAKQQAQNPSHNQENKRYIESSTPVNYVPSSNYQDNLQSPAIANLQRSQNQASPDLASMLKLNDVPHRLTQGLSSDALRFHNSNFDQASIPNPLPGRLNQNVGSHQIDVASDILNKIIASKQQELNLNRPENDPQTGGLLSTINGFRVANPFNVDLNLVAEMLKGKGVSDDTHLLPLRDQFSKPAPIKLDIAQLQQLFLKNDNYGGLSGVGDGLGAYSSPFIDIYNNGRYPYQGVKYSRSQEEEESILPIADASNTHPIGAVIEQDAPVIGVEVTGHDLTAQGDDTLNSFTEDRPKRPYHISNGRAKGDRHRHPNSLLPGRHSPRKYSKTNVEEPYPLLKPPPPSRSRGSHGKMEKHSRRRRLNKPKITRMLRTEPLFAAETSSEDLDSSVTLLRPPEPVAAAKSDNSDVKETS